MAVQERNRNIVHVSTVVIPWLHRWQFKDVITSMLNQVSCLNMYSHYLLNPYGYSIHQYHAKVLMIMSAVILGQQKCLNTVNEWQGIVMLFCEYQIDVLLHGLRFNIHLNLGLLYIILWVFFGCVSSFRSKRSNHT